MSSEKIESEQHLLRLLAAEEETATAKAATDVGHQMAVDQVHTISDQLKTQLVNIPPLTMQVNSLAPGKFELNFRHVIFKQILVIDGWDISCEIALIWMSLDFTDDQITLVQVMARCRQATSHYLSQCWPRSLSLYCVTRPQWVNHIKMP